MDKSKLPRFYGPPCILSWPIDLIAVDRALTVTFTMMISTKRYLCSHPEYLHYEITLQKLIILFVLVT